MIAESIPDRVVSLYRRDIVNRLFDVIELHGPLITRQLNGGYVVHDDGKPVGYRCRFNNVTPAMVDEVRFWRGERHCVGRVSDRGKEYDWRADGGEI